MPRDAINEAVGMSLEELEQATSFPKLIKFQNGAGITDVSNFVAHIDERGYEYELDVVTAVDRYEGQNRSEARCQIHVNVTGKR